MRTDTHTYTHLCLPLILRAHKHSSLGDSFIALPGALHDTHKHTISCVLEICLMMTHIHTPIPIPTLYCVAQHIFLFHVYRSVSLARMRRYTQLAYLFHQCATSLQRQSYCRLYCETSGRGAPVF